MKKNPLPRDTRDISVSFKFLYPVDRVAILRLMRHDHMIAFLEKMRNELMDEIYETPTKTGLQSHYDSAEDLLRIDKIMSRWLKKIEGLLNE